MLPKCFICDRLIVCEEGSGGVATCSILFHQANYAGGKASSGTLDARQVALQSAHAQENRR